MTNLTQINDYLQEEKQVKPGFTNYQPQPKYSWALSKGKLVKTKSLKNSESLKSLKTF